MKVAILTDFISHDPAYSLCGVVLNQVKMLTDHEVTVFVRKGWSGEHPYRGPNVIVLDPGKTGSNVVEIDENSDQEIQSLALQLAEHLRDTDVVLTHDLIYQANMWKYHVACRHVAKKYPDIRWIHWVHSSTNLDTVSQTGKYVTELSGPFPNSQLVAMHNEEIDRKGTLYGYERDQIVVIPNPLDVMEDYDPISKKIIKGLWKKDIVIVYPARLDRGKQIEIIGEIGRELNNQGWDTQVIIVDFHSTGGDKADYRTSLHHKFGDFMQFTSFYEGCEYHVPHKVVMDLFDYADVFIHPSKSESDPLTVPEAMWKRNLLVLNFDLPVFRQYDGRALFGKFSSAIDVHSSMPGETNTAYSNRRQYMVEMANSIAYMAQQDMVVLNHRQVRQTRSLEAVNQRYLLPTIQGVKS